MTNQNNKNQDYKEKALILKNRIKIGETIREIREKRGLSQDQLAEQMSISRSTISKIENGKFNFSIDYLLKFSKHLSFNIEISLKSFML